MKDFRISFLDAGRYFNDLFHCHFQAPAGVLFLYLAEQRVISYELSGQKQPVLCLHSNEVQKICEQVQEAIQQQKDAGIISVLNNLYGFSRDYFLKPLPSDAVCLPECVSMYQLFKIANFTLTGGYESRFDHENEMSEIIDVIRENSDNLLSSGLKLYQSRFPIWYLNSISLREFLRLLSIRRVSAEQAKYIVKNVFADNASENIRMEIFSFRHEIYDIAEKGLLTAKAEYTPKNNLYYTFSREELVHYAKEAARQFSADGKYQSDAPARERHEHIFSFLNPDRPFICELKDCIPVDTAAFGSRNNRIIKARNSFEILNRLNELNLPYTESEDCFFHFISPSTFRRLMQICSDEVSCMGHSRDI